MHFLKRNIKRAAIDTAGYLLLLAALLTGWLPGPGGIPLALAGLELLSIHNTWARNTRNYLLINGDRFAKIVFPEIKIIEWAYDIAVVLLLIIVGLLAWHHEAVWQLSLGVVLFFIAVFITLRNRNRFSRLNLRPKHKQ